MNAASPATIRGPDLGGNRVEAWIPLTLFAAFAQNLRSLLQKQLTGRLSVTGAMATRFLYAVPFALLYLSVLSHVLQAPLPQAHAAFVGWCLLGGVAQILGTQFLVATFEHRNFAVGTAYSKTETVQAAIFGAVLLGEGIDVPTGIAIGVSLCGVLLFSTARAPLRPGEVARSLATGLFSAVGARGIASGAGFAVSAVSYRAASTSLVGHEPLMQAAYTLACVTLLQSLLLLVYLRAREPATLGAVRAAWRHAVWVGIAGMLASAGWFTAMTLGPVADVRTLGQVELLFTFLTAVFWFRERVRTNEVIGVLLLVAGIVVLLAT